MNQVAEVTSENLIIFWVDFRSKRQRQETGTDDSDNTGTMEFNSTPFEVCDSDRQFSGCLALSLVACRVCFWSSSVVVAKRQTVYFSQQTIASSAKILRMTSSQSNSNAFSSEQDEHLIELVAQNPILYDLKLESYKDGRKKVTVWKDIGSALNKSSGDCKKRWKYIKDSYNRYKRKKKGGTGSAVLPKTSKWEFYERLKFLELASSPRGAISNIPSISQESQNEFIGTIYYNEDNDSHEDDNSDDGGTQSTIVNEPEERINVSKENTNNTENISKQNINNTEKVQKRNTNTEQPAPKKKRQSKQDEFIQYMKKGDVQTQASLKEQNIDEDDVNSFGDHIKSVLRKLPPILKVKAKGEIFNVMNKYELMSMETTYSTPSTSSMSSYSTYIVPSSVTSPTPDNRQ